MRFDQHRPYEHSCSLIVLFETGRVRAGLICAALPQGRVSMVDVDSAMRASAYSGKRRGRKSEDEKKEEKQSRVLEPFDPVEHAKKEKADAYSMWIVIVFGLFVAAFIRYWLMPTMTEPTRALWLLPMLLMAAIPSLHKVIVPAHYYEMYTAGNWFRACFLFLFTWLALSFIVANPPLADVAAPTLAGGLDIEETEGIESIKWKSGELKVELNQDNVDVVLGMGIRDNIDVESATISVSIWKGNSMTEENTLVHFENVEVSSLTEANTNFEAVDGNWSRGQLKNTLTKDIIGPRVAPLATDFGLAWDLGQLGPGTYKISISLEEDGAPWKGGLNTWSTTYELSIVQTN